MAADKVGIEDILARRGPRRGWVVALVVVAAVVLAGGAWLWLRGGDAAASYLTTPARRGDLTQIVTAVGTVQPTGMVEVSSEISGTVRSVTVDENDRVTKGQVLARLDTTALEAAVDQRRALVAAAEARIAEARATRDERADSFARSQRLSDRGVISEEVFAAASAALHRAEAALASAEADLNVARANLRAEEASLAKACICSPIDGLVLDRAVDPGQIVAASLTAPVLFTLAEDLGRMELQVDVDEADIGRVALDNPARFSVEAFQDRDFPARVTGLSYYPKTIDGVVTYQAVLGIDNSDRLLRPGMTAVADITVGAVKGALLIPNAALRFSPPVVAEETGGNGLMGMLFSRRPSAAPISAGTAAEDGTHAVWVLRAGVPVELRLRTGASDGAWTEVTSGDLAEGDAVITELVAAP